MKMGHKKRQRTAQRHLTETDRKALGIARGAIEDHNFRKLVQQGVIVEEMIEKCPNKQQQT